MFRNNIYFTGFVAISSLLMGCATMIDGQVQDITIETPGAENATCELKTEGNRYKASNNQTITVKRSKGDLLVNCKAAGNREKTVHVKRDVNDWIFVNVANGFVPGAAYDYASQGAFEYPSKIVVNFVGVPVKPYDLPDYHDDDLRYNNNYNKSENMGPNLVDVAPKTGSSTLEKKTLPHDYTATSSGSVYPRSNSVVPYDPNEEMK